MKFLLKTFLILLVIFLSLKFVIHLLDDGHKTTYATGNFNVEEKYTAWDNNYLFNIKNDKFNLKFDVMTNYNKASNIITKIYYQKENDYECVLPIFKGGKILTDIMCKKDDIVYFAHDLPNVTDFPNKMQKYGYNKKDFIDKAKAKNLSASLTLYENNMVDNHYLAMENYKGLTLYNTKEENIKIFENDIYTKPISLFTDKYYIVADYNNEYTFKIFKVINIINGTEKEIRSYNEISFDSYIQGVVDDDIYLFDKDAKVQYKINLKEETVEKAFDDIKYYDGSWHKMTLNEALDEKKFSNYDAKIDGVNAVKINKYYYIYENNNGKYKVYKAYDKKLTQKTFLFETSDINSIIYLNGYIYYRLDNTFAYFYSKGVRKVLENKELEFNTDLSLGVYIN